MDSGDSTTSHASHAYDNERPAERIIATSKDDVPSPPAARRLRYIAHGVPDPAPHIPCGGYRFVAVTDDDADMVSGKVSKTTSVFLLPAEDFEPSLEDSRAEQGGETAVSIDAPKTVLKQLAATTHTYPTVEEAWAYVGTVMSRCAKDRLVDICSTKEISSIDAAARLGRDGYPDDAIDQAVDWARHYGLIDDVRYAECYVSVKRRSGWGRNRIAAELGNKGIDMPAALDAEIDGTSEEDNAYRLVARRSIPKKDPLAKLVRYLVNKGFDYNLSYRVASRRLSEDRQRQDGYDERDDCSDCGL